MEQPMEVKKQQVKPQMSVVRLTMWNLDGSTSEAKLTFPSMGNNGDAESIAGQHLEEWIRTMTRYYCNITAYQVHFGSVIDGEEDYRGAYHAKEFVPTDKIFVSKKIEQGKWMTPLAIKKMELPHVFKNYSTRKK